MTTTQIPNPQTFGQSGCCTPFPGQTFQNVPFNWCGPTHTGYTSYTNQHPTTNFGYTIPNSGYWPQPFGWFNPSFQGQNFHGQSHFGSFPWNTNWSFGNWNCGIPSSNWTNWNNFNTFGSFPWSWNHGYGYNTINGSPFYGWNTPISCATPFSGECFPGCCPPSFGSWYGANFYPIYNGSFNNWSTPFNTFGFNPWNTIPFSNYGQNTIPFYGYNTNPFSGYQGGFNWPIPSSNIPFGYNTPVTNFGSFTNTGYNGVYPQGFPFPGTVCGPQTTDIHGKPGFGMNREAA
ncbi:MAG: hypothetical protein DYG93_11865 [Leptolyngbya sp. PLA2]|nr:hypothetical protein [Leptolyngbya sp.]MCE7972342.1 hypothetical protein [Leptolyngbya sp. PL-A2]MCZ7632480.1 hypothetical protein [Phycisphaerales bacterium]MDL1905063.1 hypothetical protein [Synechococcales cyanobacterium CNB]GIK19964.1 MAG: hypothetical protein BroJett004_21280 [Planctomycetota bacterium]